MKILLIVGNFYPKPSSVANCVSQLLKTLKEHDHTIVLITNSTDSRNPYMTVIDDTELLFIPEQFGCHSIRINRKLKALDTHAFGRSIKRMVKIPMYLRYYLFAREAGMIGWYTRKNARDCWSMIRNQHIDLILSFSHPFSTHFFASYLYEKLNRRISWVLYEFDPYAYNDVSSHTRRLFKRHIKQEKELFNKASRIIVTPELYDYYSQTIYKAYLGKMHQLPYTLLQVKDTGESAISSSHDGFKMLYAGSFYATIRNPLYAMKVISQTGSGGMLLLVTNYDEPVFNQTISSFPSKFEKRSMVDQDSALSMMVEADVMISVGNTIEIQVPAKIFEYMGLGKPIIHFCKVPQDPALKYLARYPLAMIINESESDVQGHAKSVDDFLKKMKGKQLAYEEVRECLPELDEKNVADAFISIVESVG